ncbi:MAG: hypothetical protein H7Z42_06875 [Roseiflexaceae bacterium]|nr:hypothetical protein [Roseiflexaceae bacterium]
MTRTPAAEVYRPLRMLPIDLGVGLLALAALLAALLLRGSVEGQTQQFSSDQVPLRFRYPSSFVEVGTLDAPLLAVENPLTVSPFKTALVVENRELDATTPPALEELVNRRIDDRTALTGYHFLASGPTTVAGAPAFLIEYAHVIQPIDEPRRASMPVVVRNREYVVLVEGQSYYFTLAAPEDEFARASRQFDGVIASVQF